MNIKEIQNLIRFIDKSGISEVSYKEKDFEIIIKKEKGKSIPYFPTVPPNSSLNIPTYTSSNQNDENQVKRETPIASNEETNYITIKSPMIGTFYRRPSPDKPLFLNVGDVINPGTPLCIIEAMKLFNEIEAEVSGTIMKILVEDSMPVEYDQPLFLVDPS